jgi:hypothetical protein
MTRGMEAIRAGKASAARLLPAGPEHAATKRDKQSQRSLALRVEPRLSLAKTPQDIAAFSQTNRHLRDIDRLLNVRAVYRLVEDIADEKGDIPLPEERPRKLWIEQWRQGAAEVGEADLRQLWARLLVGEVAKPGSVSQKTIQTLRQMSADDARLFERFGPFIISGGFIVHVTYLQSVGISAEPAVQLEDLGLLAGAQNELAGGYWPVATTNRGRAALLFSHTTRLLKLGLKDNEEGLSLPAMRLTEVGKQLMRVGNFTPDDRYLRAIAGFSKERSIIPPNPGTVLAVIAKGHLNANTFTTTAEEVVFALAGDDEAPAQPAT